MFPVRTCVHTDHDHLQPDDHEYGEADIRLAGSSNDLSSLQVGKSEQIPQVKQDSILSVESTLQNVSASTTRGTKGKGRLDSLKENLYKQQVS